MAIAYVNLPKPAWDERRISHDFDDDIPTGETISSIDSITVTDKDTGEDITDEAVETDSEQIDADERSVSALYIAGTAGQTYVMLAKVVLSNGESISGILEMEISA